MTTRTSVQKMVGQEKWSRRLAWTAQARGLCHGDSLLTQVNAGPVFKPILAITGEQGAVTIVQGATITARADDSEDG